MACCVLGAFLVGQLLVLWRRVQPRLRLIWVTASLSLAVISITYGLIHHSHHH